MNRRLAAILDEIQDGTGVIDVGTDHGYLPAALAKRGYPGNIIASDINEGPLNAAKTTADNEGLTDRIKFLLCDGLSACDPETVDTIVIAGMGGDLICRILDQAEWTMDARYTMILQPMTKAEVLRYWLSNNEYGILSEHLVEDNNKIYSILTVRFGGYCPSLSDAELFLGHIDTVKNEPLFGKFLESQITRMENALSGIKGSSDEKNGKANLLGDVLQQMREIQDNDNSSEHL